MISLISFWQRQKFTGLYFRNSCKAQVGDPRADNRFPLPQTEKILPQIHLWKTIKNKVNIISQWTGSPLSSAPFLPGFLEPRIPFFTVSTSKSFITFQYSHVFVLMPHITGISSQIHSQWWGFHSYGEKWVATSTDNCHQEREKNHHSPGTHIHRFSTQKCRMESSHGTLSQVSGMLSTSEQRTQGGPWWPMGITEKLVHLHWDILWIPTLTMPLHWPPVLFVLLQNFCCSW